MGTKIDQATNAHNSSQEFIITRTANDTDILIISSKTGYAAEVPGSSKSDVTQLDQWGLNGGANQP